MKNTQNWINKEVVITHEDGYTAYATAWFNGNEIVAIEPHSVSILDNGDIFHHYYTRIMGKELIEYAVESLD